jgi:hypothetical protein
MFLRVSLFFLYEDSCFLEELEKLRVQIAHRRLSNKSVIVKTSSSHCRPIHLFLIVRLLLYISFRKKGMLGLCLCAVTILSREEPKNIETQYVR